MPYLQKNEIYYEHLKDKKYDEVKQNIYKIFVDRLENTIYPETQK
jgi:hypothetical protein